VAQSSKEYIDWRLWVVGLATSRVGRVAAVPASGRNSHDSTMQAVAVDEVHYGGPETAAFADATFADLVSAIGLPEPAALEPRPGVSEKLASYEAAWGCKVPLDLVNIAKYAEVVDAVMAQTGLAVFNPGELGLEWLCVAPWGAADPRRAITQAIQEGQGCFYLYLVFDGSAPEAAATSQVFVGDFEWSELEAIEASPGAALRLSAPTLFAFLMYARTVMAGEA